MLPQHVSFGPLAALTGAPYIQYCNNKAAWLNESQTQFSYITQLEKCAASNPLTSSSCCDCVSK